MCSHVYGELAVTETGRCAWEIHQEIMTLIFHFYYFFVWPCRIRFMFYCRNKWQWAETIAKRNKSIENGANSTITLSRSRIFPYQARLVMMITTHTYNENFTRRGCRSIKWSYRFYWIWTAQSSVMFVITLLPSAQLIIHIYEPETATRIYAAVFSISLAPLRNSRATHHIHSAIRFKSILFRYVGIVQQRVCASMRDLDFSGVFVISVVQSLSEMTARTTIGIVLSCLGYQ